LAYMISLKTLFLKGINKKIKILCRNEGDPEDPFDENYLLSTKRKNGDSALESGSGIADDGTHLNEDEENDDDRHLDTCEGLGRINEKQILNNRLMGIDQAILQCIDRCDNEDMKRRMFSCILVVGGGMSFPGAQLWLERIGAQIPAMYQSETGSVEVITRPKATDPTLVTWKGGAIMSLLEAANDLWIDQTEWETQGLRVLREKAPFIF